MRSLQLCELNLDLGILSLCSDDVDNSGGVSVLDRSKIMQLNFNPVWVDRAWESKQPTFSSIALHSRLRIICNLIAECMRFIFYFPEGGVSRGGHILVIRKLAQFSRNLI
jgi:hypothetical protein